MVSVTELRRIRGITASLYQGLLPHVTGILPASESLNVNTMSLAVIRSLNDRDTLVPLDVQAAQEISDNIRSNEPESVTDFKNLAVVASVISDLDDSALDVKSSWFELDTTVIVGDSVSHSRSLIRRDADQSKVVQRSDSYF